MRTISDWSWHLDIQRDIAQGNHRWYQAARTSYWGRNQSWKFPVCKDVSVSSLFVSLSSATSNRACRAWPLAEALHEHARELQETQSPHFLQNSAAELNAASERIWDPWEQCHLQEWRPFVAAASSPFPSPTAIETSAGKPWSSTVGDHNVAAGIALSAAETPPHRKCQDCRTTTSQLATICKWESQRIIRTKEGSKKYWDDEKALSKRPLCFH